MGVGFVGAVMAAIVADTVDEKGKSSKFVIGMQRPSIRSFWKIPMLNQGVSPVKAEDPEVDPMIRRCVLDKKTLVATYVYDVCNLPMWSSLTSNWTTPRTRWEMCVMVRWK